MFSGQRERNSLSTVGVFGWLFCVIRKIKLNLLLLYSSLDPPVVAYINFVLSAHSDQPMDIKCLFSVAAILLLIEVFARLRSLLK